MKDYTRFTNVEADEVKAKEFKGNLEADEVKAKEFKGNLEGMTRGGLAGKTTLSKATDYTLSASEKNAVVLGVTMTAASKSLICDLQDGQIAFIVNEGGTNAFTVKNLSTDSGTSLSAGKVALVVGSKTANATAVYVLN